MGKHVTRTYHGFDVSMPRIQGGTIVAIVFGIAASVIGMIVAIVAWELRTWLILLIGMAPYVGFVVILENGLRFRIAREAYYESLSDEEKAKFRHTEAMYHCYFDL